MNKKQIIQTLIVVGAFGAAGFVLFEGGVFNSTPTPILQSAPPILPSAAGGVGAKAGSGSGPVSTGNAILPYGDKLDFSVIDPSRFDYNQFEFGKVDPKKDIGIDPKDLIIPTQK